MLNGFQYDDGGPLMHLIDNQHYLMGIMAFGSKQCGKPFHHSLYTSVPAFIDWIVDKVYENTV